jgi:3-hydroxyisobutyrate dehydrogenase-like beta-hydroxyacid dehydrogenase
MRIAFIGFGEAASAFAGVLAARGAELAAYDLELESPQGLERLKARAGATKVEFSALRQAVRGARYVLSTVTTSAARQAAEQCAAHLGAEQTYVDLNATDARTKREMAHIVTASGATFVEGAILGAIGVTGASTEILLGGGEARRAERDLAGTFGLNARFYSDEIGKASTFKMLRSVFSKGMEALLIEFLVAGERAGMREELWREVTTLFGSQPFEKVAANWVRSHAAAHARRRDEVKQVAAVLRELGLEPVLTAATEAFFERSARLGLQPAANMDEVIRLFNDRLR